MFARHYDLNSTLITIVEDGEHDVFVQVPSNSLKKARPARGNRQGIKL